MITKLKAVRRSLQQKNTKSQVRGTLPFFVPFQGYRHWSLQQHYNP